MRTKFIRLLKHAELTSGQTQRFETVLEFEKERSERSKRRHDQLYQALERRLQRPDPAQ